GWAPLHPSVGWDASVGFRVGESDFDRYVDPYAYTFVPERHFLDPVPRYVVPPSRNVTLVRDTQNVTNFRVVDRRPVNRSIPIEQVQRVTGRAVPRARVVDVDSVAAARRRANVARNEVPVFRPAVRGSKERIAVQGKAEPEPRRNARELERQRQADARQEAARAREAERQRQAESRQDAVKPRQAEPQKQAEARRDAVRQREAEQQKQADARREAVRQREAEKQRQADSRQDAVKQRQAEQQKQAEARREAVRQREAERQQKAMAQREAEAQRRAEARQQAGRRA